MDTEKKKTLKERAKEARQAAYQKAKERNKAYKLEQKTSPAGIERKLRLKEQRRAAYDKAKDAHKQRLADKKARDEREKTEAAALQDAALLESLLAAGDKPAPKLRLIKGGPKNDGAADAPG